jgi:transposase
MGYHAMTTAILFEIFKWLKSGRSERSIARSLGLDKKTVRVYKGRILTSSIPESADRNQIFAMLSSLCETNKRTRPAFAKLEERETIIRDLIRGTPERPDGMKPKTAWRVAKEKYGLGRIVSYETFKRFIREKDMKRPAARRVNRIESEPGEETQIDYGHVGTRIVDGKRIRIYGFGGILSYSRHCFIQYGPKQTAVAFTSSQVDMAEEFGGVTKRVSLDNLKAGVLSPDVYDPTINRTLGEFCDLYGVLVDPCRIATATDKGKIERLVPVMRELYRYLDALYPDASLAELNTHALRYLREERGMTKHGTTGERPMDRFINVERACLLPLPKERYIPATWKDAKVHPDQFITVNRKQYGLPASFIGCTVNVRMCEKTVQIFKDFKEIRRYCIPDGPRAYLKDDFPVYAEPFMPGSFAQFLIGKAELLGDAAASIVKNVLYARSQLGIRRAQGLIKVFETYRHDAGYYHVTGRARAQRIYDPRKLKVMFEDDRSQNILPFPVSEKGKAMIRPIDYYTKE